MIKPFLTEKIKERVSKTSSNHYASVWNVPLLFKFKNSSLISTPLLTHRELSKCFEYLSNNPTAFINKNFFLILKNQIPDLPYMVGETAKWHIPYTG